MILKQQKLQETTSSHDSQEYIPVGCVSSAAVAVSGRGCLPGGVVAGGVCLGGCPCEQNDRQVLKHYLAGTTLRTVKMLQLGICEA